MAPNTQAEFVESLVDNIRESDRDTIEFFTEICNQNSINKGFWDEEKNLTPKQRMELLLTQKIDLIHDEASEAMRELREQKISKLKFYKELSDIIIRTMDLAGRVQHTRVEYPFDEDDDVQFADVFIEVIKKNLTRPRKHGKRF